MVSSITVIDSSAISLAKSTADRIGIPAGLQVMLEAYECAQDAHRGVWDFAVEIRSLRRVGVSNTGFRWLLAKGFAQHAEEITLAGQDGRSFRQLGNLALTKRACFVLTDTGVALARVVASAVNAERTTNGRGENGRDGHPRTVPVWDCERQELRLEATVVKQFKVPAPNQEAILAAFEEESWPPHIDDPLPPQPDQDSKRRLHDTINALNRNQKRRLLRFLGDGSGMGVRWEFARARRLAPHLTPKA